MVRYNPQGYKGSISKSPLCIYVKRLAPVATIGFPSYMLLDCVRNSSNLIMSGVDTRNSFGLGSYTCVVLQILNDRHVLM